MTDAAWNGIIQFPDLDDDRPVDVLSAICMTSNAQHILATSGQVRVCFSTESGHTVGGAFPAGWGRSKGWYSVRSFGPFPLQRKAGGDGFDLHVETDAFGVSSDCDIGVLISANGGLGAASWGSLGAGMFLDLGSATSTPTRYSQAFAGPDAAALDALATSWTNDDGERCEFISAFAHLCIRVPTGGGSNGVFRSLCLREFIAP